jgi:hypothetical protein
MTDTDPTSHTHFRALSRQAVNLLGALRANGLVRNWDVRILDLGLGGARVQAADAALAGSEDAKLEAGTSIELIIEAPHLWDPLTLSGAVAWSRPGLDREGGGAQIGVRFQHETGGSVRTLTELLAAEAFG